MPPRGGPRRGLPPPTASLESAPRGCPVPGVGRPHLEDVDVEVGVGQQGPGEQHAGQGRAGAPEAGHIQEQPVLRVKAQGDQAQSPQSHPQLHLPQPLCQRARQGMRAGRVGTLDSWLPGGQGARAEGGLSEFNGSTPNLLDACSPIVWMRQGATKQHDQGQGRPVTLLLLPRGVTPMTSTITMSTCLWPHYAFTPSWRGP